MARVLSLFAHPRLQTSRTHASLIQSVDKIRDVTFHDLYESYPDFDIDVDSEQDLLTRHEIIIFQFPFYWYSCPPLIKQWTDLVLEHGWAYGQQGRALEGKKMMVALSTGGRKEAYEKGGFNQFTVREFLTPFEQTARLCRMDFIPPFVVHGTHLANENDIKQAADQYHELLLKFTQNQIDTNITTHTAYINDLLNDSKKQHHGN
jgi:glutathione-regulated potassium-efflux system ancillary protein KefG